MLPILERLIYRPQTAALTRVLILAPTRELAIQVCEEMRKFARYMQGVMIFPIYGGQPIERQIKALKKGVKIIIGTPGRVMDHMRRRTLKLENVKMVVLDEADEMLSMGFREDIETILEESAQLKKQLENVIYLSKLDSIKEFYDFEKTRMHERYLLPAIIFITICIIWDKKLFIPMSVISICALANHWYIYYMASKGTIWIPKYDTVAVLTAAVTVATFLYCAYKGYRYAVDS